VRYTDEATEDELLYFGADRYDNSGDALMGFWFLQDEVDDNGTNSIGGGTGFTGEHTEGDLLVVSNFSNGGTTSTITVYEWNTDCTKAGVKVDPDGAGPLPALTCGDANLLILASSDDALCADDLDPDPATSDDFCGIVNPNTIILPWDFTDKSGTTLPDDPNDPDTDPEPAALNGEFFEGGINLTALGLAGECFATFAVETRSSTSTTATLKDFILGDFESCAATLETQASKADGDDADTNPDIAGTVTPGTPVFDIATITGSGTTPLIDPTGTVDFFLCGPIAADATVQDCPTGGTGAGTDKPVSGGTNTTDGISTATSDNVNTAASPLTAGRYCFRAVYSGDDNCEGDPDGVTNTTTECFTVSQPTTVTTAQRWIPQDTATVTPANTDGVVSFQLYSSLNCDPTTAVGSPLTDNDADNDGVFRTNNTTITDDTTVSWRASFDPTGAEDPSTGVCETANVTFDNDGPDPAP
jgi:hypothetical protein